MAVNRRFIVKNGIEVADSAVISGTLVASGLQYPTADGITNDVLKTDGNGVLSLGKIRIEDLSDVNLASLTQGGLLIYDSATGKFVANNNIDEDNQNITTDGGFF